MGGKLFNEPMSHWELLNLFFNNDGTLMENNI